MDRLKNVIDFYLITNELKNKVRTGWKELGISSERLESVAEHIYGCLMLAIAIDSEYDLELDMYKVIRMLSLHELEETFMKDYTLRDGISKNEKSELGRKSVIKATDGLIKQDEIVALIDEFNERLTKEAVFCYHIDKIECNFQAKIYDLKGHFSKEKAIEDAAYYADNDTLMINDDMSASDIGIEYDKRYFRGDELFESLINEIQKIDRLV